MKMVLKYPGEGEVVYDSLRDFAIEKCNGVDYDSGALEEAQATATNNSAAIGSLLEILVRQGLVKIEDVCEIIQGPNSLGCLREGDEK